jgi:chromosome partitioning protein
MAGLVVTIAQRKGGAGKSTLAAQLAVAWMKRGARVAVLDIDPQASLAHWVALRRERLGESAIGFDFAALSGWRAGPWIEERARHCDHVVIDSPPQVETEARIAVRAAALVLIPVQPSPLDLWATEATLAMARGEGRPVLPVFNRVPPRSAAVERIARRLSEMAAPAAASRIGNRVALVQAMMLGLGVVETAAGSPAAAEIGALADELGAAVRPLRSSGR